MAASAIRVQGVRKRFGWLGRTVDALRGVDLSVEEGEIYGLLGRNGAGKTTLVKILLDIVRATAGEAGILGVASGRAAARRSVGYLPEGHRLPEHRTGAGALDYFAALSGVPRGERRRRIPELLDSLALGDAAGRRVRSYSKGMKQRLGLAQAILHRPRVLLLDEPTDGVDPVGRAHIRRVLEGLRDEGITIFLNSHLLGEVERLCDRVGILENGVLVREGSIASLTLAEHGYELRLDREPSPEDLAAIDSLCEQLHARGRELELVLRGAEDVDAVVDALRGRGLGIRELKGKRVSLEDVFLESVEGRREGGP